jgi:hypothetical protein
MIHDDDDDVNDVVPQLIAAPRVVVPSAVVVAPRAACARRASRTLARHRASRTARAASRPPSHSSAISEIVFAGAYTTTDVVPIARPRPSSSIVDVTDVSRVAMARVIAPSHVPVERAHTRVRMRLHDRLHGPSRRDVVVRRAMRCVVVCPVAR